MTGGLSSRVDGENVMVMRWWQVAGDTAVAITHILTIQYNTIQWDHHNITFDFFNKETMLEYRVTYSPSF